MRLLSDILQLGLIHCNGELAFGQNFLSDITRPNWFNDFLIEVNGTLKIDNESTVFLDQGRLLDTWSNQTLPTIDIVLSTT